ncbi:MAG: alpha-amylase/4-alpha-glucanotransferase domain-containing protein [Candidatus Omnitrophota bacterium]
MGKIKFSMAVHCYQPVFNFETEIEKAYQNAYLPFMETLKGFPGVKVSFHYSGNLLEWLEYRHPDYIKSVRDLLRRGQIELMGGGCFEPVMALIPEQDRQEQLLLNEKVILRLFEIKPRGVWLAERVWEPSLVESLASAGVQYTIIDDHHLLMAGLKKENIFRPYVTRCRESSIFIFPALTSLRYAIPFCRPEKVISNIQSLALENKDTCHDTCIFFADDGEKFGLWPQTHKWIYKRKWLYNFFCSLEKNQEWLQTATYSEVMDTVTPGEIREIPESSYREMMKWARGGFKNFLSRYPESGRMHKRMINVSNALKSMDSRNTLGGEFFHIQDAKRELFKAQAGCAYWHGTFGGLYLPHLRSGVYEHLIKAQGMIDKVQGHSNGPVRVVERDFGLSEHETVISNGTLDIFIKSSLGGALMEVDYKPLGVNLTNTMSRLKEDYHKKLDRSYFSRIKSAKEAIALGNFDDVHDALGVAERGLKRVLSYDDYQRVSFLTHIVEIGKQWKHLGKARASCDNFLKGLYSSEIDSKGNCITLKLLKKDKVFIDNASPVNLEVFKTITVGPDSEVKFSHKITQRRGSEVSLKYAVEFNFLIWDKTVIARPRAMTVKEFSLKDRYSGIILRFFLDKRSNVFMYPVYTVNESEMGLRKNFQGISVIIGDEQPLNPARDANEMNITMEISHGK